MLSKYECLSILELGPTANQYEIENRYTMLIKRYRGKGDAETIATLDRITMAYNILTGRYLEPEPVDPRLETVVFGKSRRQWQNIWHYGRRPFLAGLAGFGLLVYLIYSIVTNTPADFQMAVAGLYLTADDAGERVETYVKSLFPEMEKVEYQLLPIDLRQPDPSSSASNQGNSDPQSQYAYVMKMMTLIAGDTIEVFVCDKLVFDQYARQGPFADLTGLYSRLQDLPPAVLSKIKPLRRIPDDGSSTGDPFSPTTAATTASTEDAANRDQSLPIYGLDVSELHLTEGLGLYSSTQILTVGFKAGDPAQVEKFLETWIRDYELMHQQQKAYEDSIRATATTGRTTAATGSK